MLLHALNAEKFRPDGIMIIPGRQLVLKSKDAASQSCDMVFNGLPRQIRSPAPLVHEACAEKFSLCWMFEIIAICGLT
jgi:hypothetical protein